VTLLQFLLVQQLQTMERRQVLVEQGPLIGKHHQLRQQLLLLLMEKDILQTHQVAHSL